MVPKITPNHHVPIPENYEDTYSVRIKLSTELRKKFVSDLGKVLPFTVS